MRSRVIVAALAGIAALASLAPIRLVAAEPSARAADDSDALRRVLAQARDEVRRGVAYDGGYRPLTFKNGVDTGHFVYPGGDVDPALGVCTDVVIRALRRAGIDLQSRVHEDIKASPRAYAAFVTHADANIDHRRVGPLMTYFDRHGERLSRTDHASFRAGDIVVWTFGGGAPSHVGIVSDRAGGRGLPLVLHNLGPHPTEDDDLDAWPVLGHYRVAL